MFFSCEILFETRTSNRSALPFHRAIFSRYCYVSVSRSPFRYASYGHAAPAFCQQQRPVCVERSIVTTCVAAPSIIVVLVCFAEIPISDKYLFLAACVKTLITIRFRRTVAVITRSCSSASRYCHTWPIGFVQLHSGDYHCFISFYAIGANRGD